MYSAETISLNSLCEFCGLEGNPHKQKTNFHSYTTRKQHEHQFTQAEVMNENLLLYCAWDVEKLHEIYHNLSMLIAPDYVPLVQQMTELEIIRTIDLDLAKLKKLNLKSLETNTIFFSDLDINVNKPDLYQMVALVQGHKHIYFDHIHNTAHLVMDTDQTAMSAWNL